MRYIWNTLAMIAFAALLTFFAITVIDSIGA